MRFGLIASNEPELQRHRMSTSPQQRCQCFQLSVLFGVMPNGVFGVNAQIYRCESKYQTATPMGNPHVLCEKNGCWC
jgi:hypothetical protein